MTENMSRFRQSEATANRNVMLYRFIERAIDVPDEPENGNWTNKLLRYSELDEMTRTAKRGRFSNNDPEIVEKRLLSRQLDDYLSRRFKKYRRSVLKSSLGQNSKPHAHGKDSHVFYYGRVEDFLEHPDVPRYVQKYSIPTHETGPDNIEYLVKKYKVLRKYMGTHIPRAWFVLGEYRYGLPKASLGSFHTSLRAITIQREIRGKTFSEMTSEEKKRPEVQAALKRGMDKYLELRHLVADVCKKVQVDFKKFKIELDIGSASPDETTHPFDPLTYSSPNVMYDERKKEIFFIDMGWGTWNSDKQKVFEYLMGH